MRTFLVLWSSQVLSWIGSGMAGFAVGVWAYEQTGSVSKFALITFFGVLPGLLAGPFLGVLVDRWDRRLCIIVGDTVSALSTVFLLLLTWSEHGLSVWHIYLVTGVNSLFNGLQQPAFSASVALLVERDQLSRAAGLTQVGQAAPMLLSPLLAAAVFAFGGLEWVLMVDLFAALVAVLLVSLVRVPKPEIKSPTALGGDGWKSEIGVAWSYLWQRRGLAILGLVFAGFNFSAGMVHVLLAPLILGLSDPQTLGAVLSLMSVGFLGGGLLATWTKGPRRRVPTILLLMGLQAVAIFVVGLGQVIPVIGAGLFFYMFLMPLTSTSSEVLWQRKVAPELMGRVFGIRRLIALATVPLGQLLAGPLTEGFFQPLLASGGGASAVILGTKAAGQSEAISLLLTCLGFFVFGVVCLGAASRSLRYLEEEVPDVKPT